MNAEQMRTYVEENEQRLSRLAVSLCRNPDDAQDLYQETWIKAMRHFDQYDPERPFEKWIAAICVNTFKNTYKAFSKSRECTFSTAEDKEHAMSSIVGDDGPNDDIIVLRQAVDMLPEKYRILITSKFYLDYSDEDIAEILHLPVGTVKWRIHKAKELIARRMGDETYYQP